MVGPVPPEGARRGTRLTEVRTLRTDEVIFYSDGIRLEGLLQMPDGGGDRDERLPAVVLCSGYQGLKEIMPARFWGPLTAAGYACLAFDYRGFGTSEGERGRLIPSEFVEDLCNAVTFLEQRPEIDSRRIAALGWGLGGGIVVQAAAEDARIRAVVCVNGVGDAGRAVRASRTERDWHAMLDQIDEDRRRRVVTGRSRLVSPWDVVPLDPSTWVLVEEDMYGRHARFGVDITLRSAEAYYAFRPERVVHQISPRPLLIVHGADNELHPVEEARSLYAHAREPKELMEIPGGKHLDWIVLDSPVRGQVLSRIVQWLTRWT